MCGCVWVCGVVCRCVVCGCVIAWFSGCVDAWLCDCMVVWFSGGVGAWLCDCMVMLFSGCVSEWLCSLIVCCGYVGGWLYGCRSLVMHEPYSAPY